MRRYPAALLALSGSALLIAGLWLMVGGRVMYAQDQPRYVGSEECADCHRNLARDHNESAHGLALQNTQRDKDSILADFAQTEELRTVTFPGEDTPRTFTADDIVYAVGVGLRLQSYLVAGPEGELWVLPAEWNVAQAAWQPLALAASWPDPAYDWNQNCAYCHVTGLDETTNEWEEIGVQCEACHGPGDDHLDLADEAGGNPNDEELAELRAAINPATDPQVCGQCHARGTSLDGEPFPVGYIPGGSLADSYTLSSPDDTADWYPSGHAAAANMQYNEWLNSGHARSLLNLREADAEIDEACLTCHSFDYVYTERLREAVDDDEREGDRPDSLTVETAQYGVTCANCHNPHNDGEQPVHLVEEPYALCVSCHSNAAYAELYAGGSHHPAQEMFEGVTIINDVIGHPSDHFVNADGPRCTTCHLPPTNVAGGTRASHALRPIIPGDTVDVAGLADTCSACHDEAADPATLQRLIDDIQASMRARIETARAAITNTTPEWVTVALDFVEGDGSAGIHNYAYTDALLDAVDAELGLFPAAQE